jgi:hypothetical protein
LTADKYCVEYESKIRRIIMINKYIIRFLILAGFILMPVMLGAQEFPVAVGRDSTMSAGAHFGTVDGIVTILGDTLSQYNIGIQRVYPPDSLIGNRIPTGRTAFPPGAIIDYDGTNYLLVWREFNGDLNGQFVNQSGSPVGAYFTIGTNASLERPGLYGLCFGDTAYLVIFVKTDNYLYGQRVGRSGALLGGQIPISGNLARELSLAYDGTNYLTAWVEVIAQRDKDIYGQFVSKTGSPVGANFLIDGGPYYSDNPTSLAFDGTRYLLGYHESSDNQTNLYGRFITTSGSIEQTILICDSTRGPLFPSIAFDGSNYLITWTQYLDLTLLGRFWTPAGVPLSAPFVIFDSLGGKVPLGGCGFGGTMFLVVGDRVDINFSDGDVYGCFIPQTGIEEGNVQTPGDAVILRGRPNPFVSFTTVTGFEGAQFDVYDASGRKAGTYKGGWIGADLAPGVYFARRFNSSIPSLRLVKVR